MSQDLVDDVLVLDTSDDSGGSATKTADLDGQSLNKRFIVDPALSYCCGDLKEAELYPANLA